MNPFYSDFCPICHAKLEVTNSVSSYAGTVNIYDCPNNHYFLSQNADTDQPILSRFNIPLFHLMYYPEETVVYLLDPPHYKTYKYVCVLPGYFPLNWDNLEQSAQRLKNLLIFL